MWGQDGEEQTAPPIIELDGGGYDFVYFDYDDLKEDVIEAEYDTLDKLEDLYEEEWDDLCYSPKENYFEKETEVALFSGSEE